MRVRFGMPVEMIGRLRSPLPTLAAERARELAGADLVTGRAEVLRTLQTAEAIRINKAGPAGRRK